MFTDLLTPFFPKTLTFDVNRPAETVLQPGSPFSSQHNPQVHPVLGRSAGSSCFSVKASSSGMIIRGQVSGASLTGTLYPAANGTARLVVQIKPSPLFGLLFLSFLGCAGKLLWLGFSAGGNRVLYLVVGLVLLVVDLPCLRGVAMGMTYRLQKDFKRYMHLKVRDTCC
ncbi:hypothetical protein GCM10023189_48160 [Nibrella saemangeumensis]|uniref:TM2 domain-containing protein n=1 Tax=Nibrella saemangeumensis TaxID=1084526 RepID=A0ABP8NJ79_9BACT